MIVKGKIRVDGIKRCYVEWAVIKIKCPECNTDNMLNLGSDYLSHPVVGQADWLYFYCDECDSDFEIPMVIKSCEMIIEYYPERVEAS